MTTLHEVTIHLVGSSAQPWRQWQDDYDDPGDPCSIEEREEAEAWAREENGLDWRPGTAPLRLITTGAQRLIGMINLRGRNGPTGASSSLDLE